MRTIAELGRVVLRRDLLLEHVGFLPHGSAGTVIAALCSGDAYLVEFTSPVAALVPLTRDELLPIPDNRRSTPIVTWQQAKRFRIEADRIVYYLLDPDHRDGKACFFGAWGFDRASPEPFARALLQHPLTAPHNSTERDAWATRRVFDGPLTSPYGPTPPVRTVWQVAIEHSQARLLSAFEY